jgi:type IV pilus assembly protein PilA
MSGSRKGSARHGQRHGLSSISMELMIVIVIVLILLLIAVPSYLGFMSRANSATAQANLRSAIPAVEAYYLLANSSYVGLDLTWLRTFSPGVELNDPGATPAKQTATTYCVSASVGGETWYKAGPTAPLTTSAC